MAKKTRKTKSEQTASPSPRKRIMLILFPHLYVDREIQRGVQQYSLECLKRWKIMVVAGKTPRPETYQDIAGWELDGVIGFAGQDELSAEAAKLPFPFINSVSLQPPPGLPSVGLDDRAVGRMAAEYFLDRGFRNHAFFGTIRDI